MPLYQYKKKERNTVQIFIHKNRKKITKLVPLSFFTLGALLLTISVGQIFVWQWKYSGSLDNRQIVKPIPNTTQAFDTASDSEEKNTDNTSRNSVDLSKASNWFPESHQQNPSALKVSSYTLSIPKLKIKDALVIIGSEDLDKSLVHYGGTGLPGEFGSGVIFGHSVLPQFFNPTNYKTIFSTLPTIKERDEIFINYDGVLYKYVVIGMRVIDPSDISVLEQKYDDSYIGLITCVPPGTYWKRLLVMAKMVRI